MSTNKYPPMPKRYGRGFGDGEEANDWRDTYNADQMRAYADAATVAQSERHAQEIAAYELTVSNLRAQLDVQAAPVAWVWRFSDGELHETPFQRKSECESDAVGYDGKAIPLYAAPQPAAQPELTDAEICDVAKRTETAEPGRDGYILPVAFARSVIAAHETKRGSK